MRLARAGFATLLLAGSLSVAPALGPCASVARAQGVHHAGLVVQYLDDAPRNFCVQFTEDSITGLDLLQRTKLTLAYQDYGGGNVAVCSIDGRGCAYPRTPCFCKCVNVKDCTIWGFYRLTSAGSWSFSQQGAALVTVKDGDVHAWRWGRHTTSGGSPPANTTLAKVCAAAAGTTSVAQPSAPKRSAWPVLAAFGILLGALGIWSARRARSREAEQ